MQMKDGQLFHIITYGQGSMASYAAQLPPDRRWDVINYVRGLQKKSVPSAVLEEADGSMPSSSPIDEGQAPHLDSDEDFENATTQPDSQEPAGSKGTQYAN